MTETAGGSFKSVGAGHGTSNLAVNKLRFILLSCGIGFSLRYPWCTPGNSNDHP